MRFADTYLVTHPFSSVMAEGVVAVVHAVDFRVEDVTADLVGVWNSWEAAHTKGSLAQLAQLRCYCSRS